MFFYVYFLSNSPSRSTLTPLASPHNRPVILKSSNAASITLYIKSTVSVIFPLFFFTSPCIGYIAIGMIILG